MRSLIPSESAHESRPKTDARPSVGRRNPVRTRMVVVLPVGSQEAENLPFADAQVQAPDRLDGAVPFGE